MSIFQNSILSKAADFSDAVALLDRASGRSVRYSELEGFLSSRLDGFSFDGTRPFATWAAPDFSHATLLLALLARDCLLAPLSPRLPEAEALKRAEWIGAGGFWKAEGFFNLSPLFRQIRAGSAGTMLFTSGSTGEPRAVWHDLESHIANALGAGEMMLLQPGCAWLLSLPLNHVSGFSILIRCLLAGATVVFPDQKSPFKDQIEDAALTHVSLVGVQLRRLLADEASFSHLQAVLLGGGPVDQGLVSHAIKAGVPLHITYGMTETASQITTSDRLHSVPGVIHAGKPLPGREVRISPDGEIQVRGAILPRAILSGGELRQSLTEDGWFSTGDAGRFDPAGNLVVSGRRSRMFISGGENICPEVIETLLASFPQVRRVVVVGVPHEEFGARPVAFVAGEASPDRLKEFLKARLESFYVPDAFLPWPGEVSPDDAKVNFDFFSRLARESVL
ncbi:MAG: AMP-binding protein [Verrucomicrobia bacterium]|nr:AMP-binding protein [Verrucomicrobiota bacterium]